MEIAITLLVLAAFIIFVAYKLSRKVDETNPARAGSAPPKPGPRTQEP